MRMAIIMNTTISCPHCNLIIVSRTPLFQVEEPFKQCGNCNRICITKDSGTEWELLPITGRIFMIIAAIVGFTFMALVLPIILWFFISNKIIWTIICLLWIILSYYTVIDSHYQAIKSSKERMKSPTYRNILIALGLLDQAQPQRISESVSVADELKKFKELLDMEAITQDEYDSKKKQLLDL
jgi:hypothetical protein